METSIDNSSVSEPNAQKFTKRDSFIENGHVVYHEERLLIENHRQVNQAIIKFRDWRVKFESENSSVNATDIPQPYTDLIALLAHESSETLNVLAQRINSLLTPFEMNVEVYHAFYKAIKQIIKVTTHQERHGLADVILLLKGSPPTIPKRLAIYRWQAYDTTRFPTEVRNVATKRRERRKMFSRIFTDAFQQLPKQKRIDLLFDENGTFLDPGSKLNNNQTNVKDDNQTEKRLFTMFKQDDHVIIAPQTKQSRKRLCSSFDTIFYVGLNNSFDLRQRFLNELTPEAKRKRGISTSNNNNNNNNNNLQHIDMKQAWLESTTARRREKNCFYDSPMYKNIRSLKMKLLQFHEDVRPAYFGTWSKSLNDRNIVNGRQPFAKDTQVLNYDYDSEAEWDHDVDGDDIHTLDPDEDDEDDMMFPDSTDDEEEGDDCDRTHDEIKWVVPEGYLSDDEGIHTARKRQSSRNHLPIVSRPAKWPISVNKHFPMKSVILGPSFESMEEPDNHPLSDFKVHMLVDLKSDTLGYLPFNRIIDSDDTLSSSNSNVPESTGDLPTLAPLTVFFEPNKIKPPLFQREIDKILNSYKEEFINIILDNKTKTMMGLVTMLKSKNIFSKYTTAQLQAMIHDVAIQEMRETNTEYNWYLRVASASAP